MHFEGQEGQMIIVGIAFVLSGILGVLIGYEKIAKYPMFNNPEKEKKRLRKLKYSGFVMIACGLIILIGNL